MGHIVQFRVMNLHQWPFTKLAAKARFFCCNFKNLHLCSLNQTLIFPKGPNNQNTVKKMSLNVQYIRNTPNIFTDPKGSKEKYNLHYG